MCVVFPTSVWRTDGRQPEWLRETSWEPVVFVQMQVKRVRVVVGMERKLGGGEMGKHW